MQTLCGLIRSDDRGDVDRREQRDVENPMRLLGFMGKKVDVESISKADSKPSRRIMTSDEDSLCRALGELFSHQKVSILGFAVQQDLQKLAASYPHMLCFQRVIQVIDLAPMSKIAYPQGRAVNDFSTPDPLPRSSDLSLAKLCALSLGVQLDKTEQCSTWHIRPLTPSQIEYGALDAAVLIKLFDSMLRSPNSAIRTISDVFGKSPRLKVNFKFTVLHTTHPLHSSASPQSGDEETSKPRQVPQLDGVNDEEFLDEAEEERRKEKLRNDENRIQALLKRSVIQGKVRRILDTVLSTQSWVFGTKKEPPAPSLDSYSKPLIDSVVVSKIDDRESMIRRLNREKNIEDISTSIESKQPSTRVARMVGTSRSEHKSEERSRSQIHPLFIDYLKLSSSLGKLTGKSKYTCVQFCLNAAELDGTGFKGVLGPGQDEGNSGTDNTINNDNYEIKKNYDNNKESNSEFIGSESPITSLDVIVVNLNSADKNIKDNSDNVRSKGLNYDIKNIFIPNVDRNENNHIDDGEKFTEDLSEINTRTTDDRDASNEVDNLDIKDKSPSFLLEEAKLNALRALNDRSGLIFIYRCLMMLLSLRSYLR
jgi:hypothetical protein